MRSTYLNISTTEMTKSAEHAARWGSNLDGLEEMDDLTSEWMLVKEKGQLWGGRKRGGRGVKCFVNTNFVSLDAVTMGFPGKELLVNSTLKFYPNRKYGLIGENGVGKSTLLRCMAKGSIPGFPISLRLKYVQQEMSTVTGCNLLQYVCRDLSHDGKPSKEQLNARIERLQSQEVDLESQLDEADVSDEELLASLADQLAAVSEEIETLKLQVEELKKQPAPSVDDVRASGVNNVKETYAGLVRLD